MTNPVVTTSRSQLKQGRSSSIEAKMKSFVEGQNNVAALSVYLPIYLTFIHLCMNLYISLYLYLNIIGFYELIFIYAPPPLGPTPHPCPFTELRR